MGIFARVFGSKDQKPAAIRASGVLEDKSGWYYEESQDYSSSQQTIRIEQDRPGDWHVRDSFCEVDGLNEPDRLDDVKRFFAGSYRWLSLERRPNKRHGQRTIAVIGTTRGPRGKENRHHIGYLTPELAEDLGTEDVRKMWSCIRFIKFPGRRPRYLIRFDLMVEGDEDTVD
jgi:hypothetical protein